MRITKNKTFGWGALIGTLAVGLALSGCSGGGSDTASGMPSSGYPGPMGSGSPGFSGPPSGMMASGSPGMSGRGPGMSGGYPGSMAFSGGGAPMGGMGAAPAAAAATAPPKDSRPPAMHRSDPFKPFWKDPAPPPTPVVALIGAPQRFAARGLAPKPPEEKPVVIEPAQGRVAGILTGNGVYALFEGPSGQTVVKPGDVVDGYRVTSINERSITLKRQLGNTTFTQVIPLTDMGSYSGPMGGSFSGGSYGRPPMGSYGGSYGGPPTGSYPGRRGRSSAGSSGGMFPGAPPGR